MSAAAGKGTRGTLRTREHEERRLKEHEEQSKLEDERSMALTCGSAGAGRFKVLWLILPQKRWMGLVVHWEYLDVCAFCPHARDVVRRRQPGLD